MTELMGLLKAYSATLALHNRPHNGWIGIAASTNIAQAYDGPCLIETPPNGVPSLFSTGGSIDNVDIGLDGPGIGIEPVGTIPESTTTKLLRFH